jgi:hypothetical protein
MVEIKANLLGLTLWHGELEIRTDIIPQLDFRKQALLPDVLNSYNWEICGSNNNFTYFAQTLLNRLAQYSNQTNLLHFLNIFFINLLEHVLFYCLWEVKH